MPFMSPDAIVQRLILGLNALRQLEPVELFRRLLGNGFLALPIVALIFFGVLWALLILALRAVWLAWQISPAAEQQPAAARRPRDTAAKTFQMPSFSFPTGAFTMPPFLKKIAGVLAALVVLWVLSPFAIVPAGSRGVITTFGKVSPEVLDEGLHFRIPIAQTVHLMDVRIQKGEGSGDAASRDMQQVHTSVALNYHVSPDDAANVFRDLGQNIGDRIIVPAVQEAVKAATAQYTAEELIAKRPEVRDRIRALLVERLTRHGVVVDEFSIVNFEFSKSFNEAIEAKTTAEQLKLKAERDLQRIRVEAEQKITQAKAEAESLAVQKQQVTAELIRLREIENQRKAIEKWDGRLPQVTGGATPFINVQPGAK